MLVNEILLEFRDADLYHGTSYSKAEGILLQNMMQATRPIDLGKSMAVKRNKQDKVSGHWQYIVSFSRSMSVATSFAQRKTGERSLDAPLQGVVFVMDQTLLRQDHGRRLMAYNDLQYTSRIRAAELEESLVGDLKNVSKYLKKIYVFAPPDQVDGLAQLYPVVFKHPKAEIVQGQKSKKTVPRTLQAYPTAREIDHTRKDRNEIT